MSFRKIAADLKVPLSSPHFIDSKALSGLHSATGACSQVLVLDQSLHDQTSRAIDSRFSASSSGTEKKGEWPESIEIIL